ncbi:MAG TPA: adenylate cyclase [Paenibacillaceae bacterium]|nr:adenylate cyclase [Paenibacillaceae bacterium]
MNGIIAFLTQYNHARRLNRFSNRKELEAYQKKAVEKFLKTVLPRSTFYCSYLEKHSIQEWRQFPIIDKSIMMENFDGLNTAGIKKEEAFKVALQAEKTRDFTPKIKGITIGLSSGTSGNRGLFLVSKAEQMAWAGNILGKVLPTSLFFGPKQKIAFFLRANSNLYTTLNGFKIQFHFFDLFSGLEKNVAELDEFQPTILVGPPSMLRLLARAQKEGKLSIHPIKIVSVAEVLDPMDQAYMEDVFQQRIHQIYQCTEGFLGFTCSHGTLHLNEDILIIEKDYLDESLGKFMPILTDFQRTTQPIIRYRLNDILTEKKDPCPCGSPYLALEYIEGRCDDLFYLKAKKEDKMVPVFPDFIRRAIITASENIEEYKVVQESNAKIHVYLLCEGNKNKIENQVRDNLYAILDQLECVLPELTFSYGIHLEKGAKMRRIQRK